MATSEARNAPPVGNYILLKSATGEAALVLQEEVDNGNWGQLAFSAAP